MATKKTTTPAKGVKAKMQELSQNFPAGIQYNVTLDTTDVIHASIDEVMVTFLETTLLVVLVIFLFQCVLKLYDFL